MMEKSSQVHLSEAEKKQVRGEGKMEKRADKKDPRVPERFQDWYTHEELQKISK